MMIRNPTTAEGTTVYEFEKQGYIFVIKNFTEGDIYVGPEGSEKTGGILIPAGTAQVITMGKTDKIQIIAESASDKGVEVQCIRY